MFMQMSQVKVKVQDWLRTRVKMVFLDIRRRRRPHLKSWKSNFVIYWYNIETFILAPFTQIRTRVGFSWMTPFRGAKFDGVRYAIRGWFGGVCTRVGSTYVWEWAPRGSSSKVNL